MHGGCVVYLQLARWSGYERDARKESNIAQLQDLR